VGEPEIRYDNGGSGKAENRKKGHESHQLGRRLHVCNRNVSNRQVAGSIPDCVSGFFHWHNPLGRTMVLGSIQPLTEMSTRNISWVVNAAGEYG
jgi:hypothetical protein